MQISSQISRLDVKSVVGRNLLVGRCVTLSLLLTGKPECLTLTSLSLSQKLVVTCRFYFTTLPSCLALESHPK